MEHDDWPRHSGWLLFVVPLAWLALIAALLEAGWWPAAMLVIVAPGFWTLWRSLFRTAARWPEGYNG